MKTKFKTYEELELIDSPTSELKNTKMTILSRLLGSIWKALVAFIASGNQLKIWQSKDRKGNTWWHIYNPATGQRATFSSEAEVRIWLDRSYRF